MSKCSYCGKPATLGTYHKCNAHLLPLTLETRGQPVGTNPPPIPSRQEEWQDLATELRLTALAALRTDDNDPWIAVAKRAYELLRD